MSEGFPSVRQQSGEEVLHKNITVNSYTGPAKDYLLHEPFSVKRDFCTRPFLRFMNLHSGE
jgi:hypothetical protein